MVFQQPGLLPWLDVRANVGFGLDFARQPELGKAARAHRIAQAIDAVGLGAHAHAYPSQLAGGQAQRVALARALAREPELLFADEPFSALDAITRSEMQTLLVDLVHRWHTAALLVTHDIDEALLVADRILLMAAGSERADQGGRIVREWRIDLSRPREDHADALVKLRFDILAALRRDAASTV
jgi:NitT/TauT family transport system ATP-binding protein